MNSLAFNDTRSSARRGFWTGQPTATVVRIRFGGEHDYIAKFGHLLARWKTETEHTSSIEDIAFSPAMNEIVAMGRKVLPIVFAQLRDEASFLFLAAARITGENPAPSGLQGDVHAISEAWLRWAERTGADAD